MTDFRKAFNIVYDYVFLGQEKFGAGRHIWDVRAIDMVNFTKVCVQQRGYALDIGSDNSLMIVSLGHFTHLLSINVASQGCATLPVNSSFRTIENWLHVPSDPFSNLGKPGILC